MSVLEIDNLSFSYRKDEPLLQNVSVSFQKGDIFCLLGPNGSGKTTLISQILFPSKENRDRIKVNRTSVSQMSLSERAKRFGYVPQKIPFPHISVIQTVIMGRYPHKRNPFLKVDAKDQRLAEEALKQLGLTHHANRQLYTLSGGEVQRVFIAQSIAKQAEIYFFDEPMSALDPEYQAIFLDLISWLSERNATIIFTTHNPNHVFSLNKKTRVGILGKNHVFQEVAIDTQHGIEAIEKAYNGAVSISYLAQEDQYVARFNTRRAHEASLARTPLKTK